MCISKSFTQKQKYHLRSACREEKKNIVGGNEKALRRWELASADTVFTEFPKTPHITFDLR